ncbi:MAG: VanW family protein [Clostridia bacterium]|nr:VanW family protein [Clostridia bacterium]
MQDPYRSVPGRGFVPPAPARQQAQRGFQPANGAPVTRRPKRKGRLLWLVLIPLIALMAVLGVSSYRMEQQRAADQRHTEEIHAKVDPYDGVFCPGVYVDDIHLGGMAPQEAKAAVEAQVRQRSGEWRVRLTYGENYKDITADMLNFTTDVNGVLQQAWNRGHTGDTEQRYADMLQLEQEPYRAYTAQPSGDTRVIDSVLATVKSLVDKPAKDASLVGVNKDNISDPFVYEEEEYGLSLNTEPLRQELYRMVSVMESGSLEIVPDRIEPAVHKADLMKRTTLRASAYTKIHTSSDENRNNNIRHALQDFINGYRLEPGKTFSFNKVVGMRTAERGFYPADEIVSGEFVEGYGGGVCQASTTLYQAAVCAGLQIVTRQPHSEKVRYTELGLDATVYLSKNRNKDFVFKNNTDSDIWIFAVVEKDPTEKGKNRIRARVDIYGADMGDVWYQMESVITETIEPPAPEYRKDKKSQYVTYQDEAPYLYSEGRQGYKVDVWLADTRSKQKTWLYTDEYAAKGAVYYTGVKTRE